MGWSRSESESERPVQTRFRSGSPSRVNLATHRNSQAHSSKGTPSPCSTRLLQALTACKHTVSGTISLPSRGAFHLSLTVLVRYRSQGSIQAYQVVLADSHRIHGPGATREQRHAAHWFRLRGSHPLRHRTHHGFDYHCAYTSQGRQTLQTLPTTPDLQPLPGITQTRFSLLRFRSPLLTESLFVFSSRGY